jgi:hypothetical protein
MASLKTSRDLLLAVGIGDFNATMIVPFVLVAPATTDPKSPSIMLMVGAIQRELMMLGAPIRQTGYLDHPTADVLEFVMGPGWMNRSWADVLKATIQARRQRRNLTGSRSTMAPPVETGPAQPALSGPLDFLPDVPGGLLTYAVGGYLLYRALRTK